MINLGPKNRYKRHIQFHIWILFAIMLQPLGKATPSDWVQFESTQFTVVSNTGHKQLNTLLDDLESFNQLVNSAFPEFANKQKPRKHLIVYPKNEREFQELVPSIQNVSGLYLSSNFNPIILIRNSKSSQGNKQITFHEYTHHLLNTTIGSLPLWAEEGIAELFGSFYRNDTSIKFKGLDSATKRKLIKDKDLLSLPTFFNSRSISPHQPNRQTLNIPSYCFYQQAKALAHYAYFASDGALWNRYLELANYGKNNEIKLSDIRYHLGVDLKTLKAELIAYLKSKQKIDTSINLPTSPQTQNREFTSIDKSTYETVKARVLVRTQNQWTSSENRNVNAQSAQIEYEYISGSPEAARQLAWKLGLNNADDPFIQTLAIQHLLVRSVDEIDLYNPKTANQFLEHLTTARRNGDNSRLLFEIYYTIARNANIHDNDTALDFLYQGINQHPEISYASEVLSIITDNIFRSN